MAIRCAWVEGGAMSEKQSRKRLTGSWAGGRRNKWAAAMTLAMVCVVGTSLLAQVDLRTKAKRDGAEVSVMSLSAGNPSKEYIYAGARLIATEEPVPVFLYQGSHDGAGCDTISGWAWDQNNTASVVNVDIYDGNTFIGTTPANMYREDLLNALGSPNHGFSYLTPASLKNGAIHVINVKFSGTSTLLSNTARPIKCSLPPSLLGRHDGQGCNAIEGWAWDGNDPNGTVNVDIYDGATLISTLACTLYRQDLADALGSPYHGFIFHTPASLKDGLPHTISVKFGGTNTNLSDSPRTSSCASNTPNYQGSHVVADCISISGYAWDVNDDQGTINAAIYVDGGFFVVVPAQQAYPGVGNGYHGFKFAVPASLKNSQAHSIRVKFSGTSTDLANTPKTITCLP